MNLKKAVAKAVPAARAAVQVNAPLTPVRVEAVGRTVRGHLAEATAKQARLAAGREPKSFEDACRMARKMGPIVDNASDIFGWRGGNVQVNVATLVGFDSRKEVALPGPTPPAQPGSGLTGVLT